MYLETERKMLNMWSPVCDDGGLTFSKPSEKEEKEGKDSE